eukprot:6978462-Alexandrium_andersonii.AAC.1
MLGDQENARVIIPNWCLVGIVEPDITDHPNGSRLARKCDAPVPDAVLPLDRGPTLRQPPAVLH